jgi:hypothetical protein
MSGTLLEIMARSREVLLSAGNIRLNTRQYILWRYFSCPRTKLQSNKTNPVFPNGINGMINGNGQVYPHCNPGYIAA